jgi:hypothetical protein
MGESLPFGSGLPRNDVTSKSVNPDSVKVGPLGKQAAKQEKDDASSRSRVFGTARAALISRLSCSIGAFGKRAGANTPAQPTTTRVTRST